MKRVLERLSSERGLPESIVVDNGPEFISQVMDEWAYRRGVKPDFIWPGKPTGNAFVESSHDKFRDECLDEHCFSTMGEARMILEDWRVEFNTFRPHRSLKGLTPEEFLTQQNNNQTPKILPYDWLKKRGRVTLTYSERNDLLGLITPFGNADDFNAGTKRQ